ncbi:hypothetical protein TrLO_g15642 [Triparma laevis f. longispina]|uniref:Uncharacterized protein n=1 Tax=Triparma laevis f. longispina TaxID=1714387 RepID=A0A9W7ASY0_9STRA|nr:hypothetical protein TrLO_g15642 [Triparma laevis f. longispina]
MLLEVLTSGINMSLKSTSLPDKRLLTSKRLGITPIEPNSVEGGVVVGSIVGCGEVLKGERKEVEPADKWNILMRTSKRENRRHSITHNTKWCTDNTLLSPKSKDTVITPSSPLDSPCNSADVIWFSCDAKKCTYKALHIEELEAHKKNVKLDKCPMVPTPVERARKLAGAILL